MCLPVTYGRFVKYVSASAPGSRWDIAVEYEISVPAAGSDEDESGSGSDDDEEEA
jgi:hypothetical protein